MIQQTHSHHSSHRQRLKNCKRIYDQLHLPHTRAYVLKKPQNSEPKYYSQQLKIKQQTSIQKKPHKLSMPKIGKNRSNEKSKVDKFQLTHRSQDKKGPDSPRIPIIKRYPVIKSHSKHKSVTKEKDSPQLMLDIEFTTYLEFIHSDTKDYKLYFNFDRIRNASNTDIWKQLDIKNAYIVCKFIEQIIQNLKKVGIQELFNKGSTETPVHNIKHFCSLYFNNYEKIKAEIILCEYYFKLFTFRISPIFIFQRLSVYFVYIMTELRLLDRINIRHKIKQVFDKLKQSNQIITSIIQQTNKTNKAIDDTFKMLKSVSQIEKKISFIDNNLTYIKDSVNSIELVAVYKKLQPYIGQNKLQTNYELLVKTQMELSWKYLHVPPTPFLPPMPSQYYYTAILDLKQTIIHFDPSNYVLKYRPGMDALFRELKKKKFEIIIFSTDNVFYHKDQTNHEEAPSHRYTDLIINQIESKGKIFNYRLFGEHQTLYNGKFIKDIRRMGRDLKRVILIDDIKTNFGPCPENGIEVSSWFGDKTDNQLYEVTKIIERIQHHDERDQQSAFFSQLQAKNRKKRSLSSLSELKDKVARQHELVDMREVVRNNSKALRQMLQKCDHKKNEDNLIARKTITNENQFLELP